MKSSSSFIKSNIFNFLLVFMLVLTVIACTAENGKSKEAEVTVRKAMQEQMDSWNNGNIPEFMNYYWRSDSLKFVSKNGISKGWEKVLNNYNKAYPTPEKMGVLFFDLKEVRQVSNDCVLVIGSWNLEYAEKPNVGGYFTLLWKLSPEGWRIVVDHTS